MKKWICVLAIVLIATNVFAAEIRFDIPDAKLPRVVNAMTGMFPIPDADGDGSPDYTPGQWSKESVRRWIVSIVHRWEASEAARVAGTAIQPDDGLVN